MKTNGAKGWVFLLFSGVVRFGWESERRECLGFWSRVIYLERPSWPEKCVMCWACATF